MRSFEEGTLSLDGEENNEYALKEKQTCWVRVKNLSIYIQQSSEGVAVDIFPVGEEIDKSLASTWALFSEGGEVEKK